MSDVYQNIRDRLFAKYRHSPNILKVFEILSDPLQDTNDAVDWILDHLSIDDAGGEMLDAMAGWIGVKRPPAQEPDMFRLYRDEEVADDIDNHHGLATDGMTEGGYLSADDGCLSRVAPGTYASDDEFRKYVRAKASTFRTVATPDAMFEYIMQFSVRPKFAEGVRLCEIEPSSYDNLDLSVRYHIENRGFNPCGIQVRIKPQQQSDSEV